MPHDKYDIELNVGDCVNIPCTIVSIEEATDYCNISVLTIEKMYPGDSHNIYSLNSKQVYKAEIISANKET